MRSESETVHGSRQHDCRCHTLQERGDADRLTLQAARRAAIIVRRQLALPTGHLVTQVLSHPPADLVAEYFHLSKAHVSQIDMSVIDPFLHEFFGKPIDERFEGIGMIQDGVTFIHDCLLKRGRLRILRLSPEFTQKRRFLVLTFPAPQ